jgi:hypothetical protein
VGNTNAESAITNVTEITTSENDTLPLFYNFYSQEDMTTTGAYVNASSGSWLSGNVYPTAYVELVKKLGTDNVKAVTDSYTDYDFVVNQDNMTFRLPLKNGQEGMFATRVKGNGMTLGWTDGTTTYGTATANPSNASSVARPSSNALNKSLGTVISGTTDSDIINAGKETVIGITTDSSKSGIEGKLAANTDKYLYICVGNTTNYEGVADVVNQGMEILEQVNQGIESRVKLDGSNAEFTYITETYQNGTSWYRIWSDGWCEQGGYFGSTVNNNNGIATLLKPFKDNNYNIQVTVVGSEGYGFAFSKTPTSIVVGVNGGNKARNWHASGFIA